jgi:hypothetical protein
MWTPLAVAILVAIGCGGKPEQASATPDEGASAPIQVAQTPATGGSGGGTTASGSGSVRGIIRFEGAAPAPEKVKMDADPVCQQQHSTPVYTEEVAVGNGALKNVFVYVKEGAGASAQPPTTPVTLDQSGCWYMPHVFGIQVNQPLEILNSDATLHNVNAKPSANAPFNVAQPTKGMKTTKKFAKPETGVKFKCNVHPWMSAYAHVVPHPFFGVSGEDGSFMISGLPAGTYTLEAWHEKYGTQSQQVTVEDGEAKTANFTFKAQ